jgi:hypothetical protein
MTPSLDERERNYELSRPRYNSFVREHFPNYDITAPSRSGRPESPISPGLSPREPSILDATPVLETENDDLPSTPTDLEKKPNYWVKFVSKLKKCVRKVLGKLHKKNPDQGDGPERLNLGS